MTNRWKSTALLVGFISVLLVWSASVQAFSSREGQKSAGSYNHDRWITECRDQVQEFQAFVSCFDGSDDDDGDGKPDHWYVSHWVAQELRAYDGMINSRDIGNRVVDLNNLVDKGSRPINDSYRYSNQYRDANSDWFVRGHLARKFNAWRIGQRAAEQTLSVTNIIPQRPSFNGGIWNDLEELEADCADEYGVVWIIAGPIFKDLKPSTFVGEESKGELLVAAPDALFKIIVRDRGEGEDLAVMAFERWLGKSAQLR